MLALVRSGTPLYLQVSQALEKQIASGEFPPGSRLPGDVEISETHGVSLITARAAMRVLIDKKRIVRYPGKGTFVLTDDQVPAEWRLGSLADLVLIGKKSQFVLLERRLCVPPRWIAEKYALARGAKLYLFRTARETRGERFTVTDIYHPLEIGKRIRAEDLEALKAQSKLMVTVAQEKSGLRAHSIRQYLSADLADAQTVRDLGIELGAPYLLVERDFYSEDGRLIQTGRSKYRVDRFRYKIDYARFDHRVDASQATAG